MPDQDTPSVIAPGNHDGVHLGHRALIEAALDCAKIRGLRTVALTFDPHPTQVLSPSRVPPLLTTIERRTELLRLAGADQVVVQPFGRDFASLTPEQFLRTSVIDRLRAKALVVGPDFGFGSKRSGNIDTLRQMGEKYGFDVTVVQPVVVAGQQVSSSAIRQAIAEGDLPRATLLLGRLHEVTGEVVAGCGRGKQLGVPTANLRPDPVMQPPDGVYAVAARMLQPEAGERLMGVANIGVRPTFDAGRSLEVHLFDFDGDLYGARVRIGFVQKLRGEKSFQGAEQLRAQIETDAQNARQVLQTIDREMLTRV
jgi:riboflavin kinase/FMN adenylyltransferase